MEILELFKKQLAGKSGTSSRNTIKNYVSDVRHFIAWFEATTKSSFDANEITSDVIFLYQNTMGGMLLDGRLDGKSQLSAVSMKRHLSSIRKFFTLLEGENIVRENPFKQIVTEETIEPTDYWHLKSFRDYLMFGNASKMTVKNYLSDIQGFARWYEEAVLPTIDNPLSSNQGFYLITQSVIEDYRKRLSEIQNAAPRTINRKLSALRRYLEFAIKKGFISNQEVSIDSVSMAVTTELENEPKVTLSEMTTELAPRKNAYSRIPPIRLFQKLIVFPYLLIEETTATAIASLLSGKEVTGISQLSKKLSAQIEKKNMLRVRNQDISSLLGVRNVEKEFYAPDKISLLGLPMHRKLVHHIRFTRPNWYKKYHNYAFVHYIHFALLVIFASGVGVALYQNLVVQKQTPTFAAATAPPRILSFQGRLTDNLDNPITSPQPMRFMIYNTLASSGSAELWEETRTVSPDQDGIFSVLLGSDSTGANASSCGTFPPGSPYNTACLIPSTVFSDNSQIWLGVTVANTSELSPRQKIATVGYATNSEFLQGLPPTTQGGITSFKTVVLALDSSGNFNLSDTVPTDHTFQVGNGAFILKGQTLNLTTNLGSSGNVILNPEGLGKIDLEKPVINDTNTGNLVSGGVEINDKFGVLATESAVAAFVVNNNTTGGDIFAASSSGTTRFVIGNDGTITSAVYTGQNAVLYGTQTTGVIAQATTSSTGLCLQSGASTPTWGTCGSSYWNLTNGNGALTPFSSTLDLLIGGQSTGSAKFGFINNASGSPTATISGNLSIVVPTGGNGANLFKILNGGSLRFQTSGGGDAGLTSRLFIANDGRIGVGTTFPFANNTLDVRGISGTGSSASISAQSSYATLVVDNAGSGDLIAASSSGVANFVVKNNGDVIIGPDGGGKLTVSIIDPYLVQNQKTSGIQSLTFQTLGATNADFIFQNTSTTLSTLTMAGQFQLPITGSTGGIVLGADTQIFRGAANRIDVATGDSINLVSGALQVAGATVIDASGNGTFGTLNITGGCTGCGSVSPTNAPLQVLSGAIVPLNSTLDFLIGSQSSTSAKFAVININSGIPTASISAQNVLGQALVLGSDGSIQSTSNNTLAIGGGTTGNLIIGRTSQTVSLPGFTTNGGLLYTTGGVLAQTGAGTASQCLLGGATPTFGSCSTGGTDSPFQITAQNAIVQGNTTYDFLIGGTSTSSAKFAVLNIAGGTPTASVSAQNAAGQALVISGDGTIQSVRNNTLTLGGDTTGNISILPNNSSGLVKIGSNTTGIEFTSAGVLRDIDGSILEINDDLQIDTNIIRDSSAATRITLGATTTLTNTGLTLSGTSGITASSLATLATSATFAINTASTINTDQTALTLFNTTATTLSFAGAATTLNIGGAAGSINFGNGGATTFTTASNDDLTITPNGTGNIILTSDMDTGIRIGSASNTPAPLSVSGGIGNNSALIVNQLNSTGDILAASSAGVTKFVIKNDGTASSSAGFTINGIGSIQSTNNQTLTVGGGSTGNLILGRSSQTLTLPTFTTNGGLLYTNASGVLAQTGAGGATQCLLGGAGTPTFGSCATGVNTSPFYESQGAIVPGNTTEDFLVGGTATTSAKFAVLNVAGGTPTASVSAGTAGSVYVTATGTLATTANQTLTVGTSTTGEVRIGTDSTARFIGIGNTTGTSALTLDSGTGAINIGTTIAKTITLGNITGATAVNVNTGTGGSLFTTTGAGDFTVTSGDDVTINGGGASAAISIGTVATAHTIIIGNETGATSLELDSGTGAISIGNAIAKTITIGNITGATAVNVNTGTGGSLFTTTGAGDFTVTSGDDVTINGGGASAAISIGTVATAHTIIIGNETGATSLELDSGTGAISIGNAIAKTLNIGNATGATALNLNTGTGGINFGDNANTKTIDIGGVTSSGTDTINIATEGTAADVLSIGNSNASTTVAITGGNDWSITAGGALTVASCTGCGGGGGSSNWVLSTTNGTLSPINNTVDFLIGNTASSSANFAVLGIAAGTSPTASISATSGASSGNGISLSGNGSIQSLRMNTLTIGGSTTGDVWLRPSSGTGFTFIGNGAKNISFFNTGSGLDLNYSSGNVLNIGYDKLAGSDVVVGGGSVNGARLGVGNPIPTAKFEVWSGLGTVPAASVSAQNTPTAALLVTKDGGGNHVIAASYSGAPIFYVASNGDIGLWGTLVGEGGDYAEYFKKADPNEQILAGQLVCLEANGATKCTSTNPNQKIIGVVSDNALITGGGKDKKGDPRYVLAGMVGQLGIHVSGSVKKGDPLTISSTPGVAISAKTSGNIIGYAMESNDGGQLRVSSVIQPNYFNPNTALKTDAAFNQLNLTVNNGIYTIFDTLGNSIDNIDAFSKAIIANLEVGFAHIRTLAVDTISAGSATLGNATANTFAVTANTITIGGQDIRQFIIDTVTLAGFTQNPIVSPLAEVGTLKTNLISPLAEGGNIKIKGKLIVEPEVVASNSSEISLEVNGSASISGSLATNSIQTNDATVAGTLRAGNLIAGNIQGLEDKISSVASQFINNQAATLAVGTVRADFGIFEQGITSMGPVTANIITATDQLAVGNNFTISNNAINTVGSDLAIQSLRQGAITFQGGLIRMDTDGNMAVNGNFNLLGEIDAVHGVFSGTLTTPALATDLISPVADSDISLKFNDSKFSIHSTKSGTGSAVLSIDNQGNIKSSGSATLAKLNFNFVGKAEATSLTEAIATGSAGFATLRGGQPELTIKNHIITSKSLIYITPFGNTDNKVLYLLRQIPESETDDGSFTVGISGQLPTHDVQFNWLIVN